MEAHNSVTDIQSDPTESDALNPWLDEPILPDGWHDGEDLFAVTSPSEAAPENTGVPATDASSPDNRNPGGTPDNQTPAVIHTNSADTDTNTNPASPEEKHTYRLKVNHQEREVTLTDAEVIARLQKSYAFDEWKRPADLSSQIEQARALFPDLTEVPEEVASAVASGSPFLSAYTAYRVRESERQADQIRRENAILRQNQNVMNRAPVRGVTGGGAVQSPPLSDFERGFDADNW